MEMHQFIHGRGSFDRVGGVLVSAMRANAKMRTHTAYSAGSVPVNILVSRKFMHPVRPGGIWFETHPQKAFNEVLRDTVGLAKERGRENTGAEVWYPRLLVVAHHLGYQDWEDDDLRWAFSSLAAYGASANVQVVVTAENRNGVPGDLLCNLEPVAAETLY